MGRVIIDNKTNLTDDTALGLVSRVIKVGRVSVAAGIRHYCWNTVFSVSVTDQEATEVRSLRRVVVHARRKRSVDSADSFLVCDE